MWKTLVLLSLKCVFTDYGTSYDMLASKQYLRGYDDVNLHTILENNWKILYLPNNNNKEWSGVVVVSFISAPSTQ